MVSGQYVLNSPPFRQRIGQGTPLVLCKHRYKPIGDFHRQSWGGEEIEGELPGYFIDDGCHDLADEWGSKGLETSNLEPTREPRLTSVVSG
jgi:hypothetical protein